MARTHLGLLPCFIADARNTTSDIENRYREAMGIKKDLSFD